MHDYLLLTVVISILIYKEKFLPIHRIVILKRLITKWGFNGKIITIIHILYF